MSDNQLDLNAIRKRVEKRIEQRKELITHAGIYFIVNAMFWVLWAVIGSGVVPITPASDFYDLYVLFRDAPIPLFLMAAWGIGLAIHALVVFLEMGMFERMKEREFEREITRERARLYAQEKPKRRVELTEDGELTEDADESEPSRRTSRAR
jgi:hypothetical protein